MRGGKIGAEGDGFFEDFDGLFLMAGLREGATEGVEELEVLGTDFDGGLKGFDRLLELSHLHQGGAEVYVGVEEIGL
jgi:hypothetical protein